jgi:hypothetical protein
MVLVLEVCVALGAQEVYLNLMTTPRILTFTAPGICDVVVAAVAVVVCLLQMIIESGRAKEIHLTVGADIVMSRILVMAGSGDL